MTSTPIFPFSHSSPGVSFSEYTAQESPGPRSPSSTGESPVSILKNSPYCFSPADHLPGLFPSSESESRSGTPESPNGLKARRVTFGNIPVQDKRRGSGQAHRRASSSSPSSSSPIGDKPNKFIRRIGEIRATTKYRSAFLNTQRQRGEEKPLPGISSQEKGAASILYSCKKDDGVGVSGGDRPSSEKELLMAQGRGNKENDQVSRASGASDYERSPSSTSLEGQVKVRGTQLFSDSETPTVLQSAQAINVGRIQWELRNICDQLCTWFSYSKTLEGRLTILRQKARDLQKETKEYDLLCREINNAIIKKQEIHETTIPALERHRLLLIQQLELGGFGRVQLSRPF